MKVQASSSPFGAATRTRTLLALRLLDESHGRELARLLEASLSGVQKALQSLERDGLIAARAAGRTRLYRLSPRAAARRELAGYLDALLATETELRARSARLRRRPRRSGKPL
jgi:DNA-binding MarR family transcriptional regulator